MEPKTVVMIVMLAMPNGDSSVQVKPMDNVRACRDAAEIEASDPFVAGVQCSVVRGSVLQLGLDKRAKRKPPETSNFKSTG